MRTLFVTLALVVVGALSPLHAQAPLTITDVKVDIYYSLDNVTLNSASTGWKFPVSLGAGEDLVLTQNNGVESFDTSEVGCYRSLDVPNCNTGWALVTIVVNGETFTFWDLNRVLTLKGHDPFNTSNEAQEYSPCYQTAKFDVFCGYADREHPAPCGTYATSVGLFGAVTCVPTPFEPEPGSAHPTYFQGKGAPVPVGLVQTEPNHCNEFRPCYDGGVIRIVAHADLRSGCKESGSYTLDAGARTMAQFPDNYQGVHFLPSVLGPYVLPLPIPAGLYNITITTGDKHNKADELHAPPQLDERVKVWALDNRMETVAMLGPTNDVPDTGKAYETATTVFSRVRFDRTVPTLYLTHGGPLHVSEPTNSVDALSVEWACVNEPAK